MKSHIAACMGTLAAAFTLVGQTPSATNTPVRIGTAEAKDYVGKSVTVTGKVVEVHFSEKLVRMNLDKPFPRQPFTAVVFASRTNYFGDFNAWKNKQIEIKGSVQEYRGRPEIVLHSTNQVQVVSAEGQKVKN